MIILSVDYGDKRTGIAVCNKSETLATGIKVITEWNAEELAAKITAEAGERGAELIVIGLPKNMDGTCGYRTDDCRKLGALIEAKTSVPIDYWDERLTTVSAHTILNEVNVRGKARKNSVDAVSAEIILQDYIDHRRIKG